MATFSKASLLFKSLIQVEGISQNLKIHNERTDLVKLPPGVPLVLLVAVLHHHVQWGGQQLPLADAPEAGPGQPREQLPAGLRLQHHHGRPWGMAKPMGKHYSQDYRCLDIRRGKPDHWVNNCLRDLNWIIIIFFRIYVVNPPPPTATKVSCSWKKPDGNRVLRNFVICTKDSDTICFICQPGATGCCK